MKAISVAFGIFMGIVPLWGFQLLIAIPLSIFFRLNTALVVVAANISIPPMIPLILFLSHLTGIVWMGSKAVHLSFDQEITLQTFQDSILQYVLGATTLAVIAALIAGATTWAILKLTHKKS